MAVSESFSTFIFDQLQGLGEYQTKKMFGGLTLLKNERAFALLTSDEKVYLKVNETCIPEFEQYGMQQFTYGKNGSRRLHFYQTPIEIIEDRSEFVKWAKRSIQIALSH